MLCNATYREEIITVFNELHACYNIDLSQCAIAKEASPGSGKHWTVTICHDPSILPVFFPEWVICMNQTVAQPFIDQQIL